MRLSDADRERLYDELARHAAEGRLDLDELERRVAAVSAATTFEEAGPLLADLPQLTGPPPARRPGRRRGHGDAERPAPGWQATGERFRDPSTNRVMRVWVDAEGGRHYVADA